MRYLWRTAVGLCLAPLLGLGAAHGSELAGGVASGPKALPAKPALVKEVPAAPATCGSHGTSVDFLDTPSEAAKEAKKAGKLVFVLHVSGNFEDPRFT
jgi:hypothetical protein